MLLNIKKRILHSSFFFKKTTKRERERKKYSLHAIYMRRTNYEHASGGPRW